MENLIRFGLIQDAAGQSSKLVAPIIGAIHLDQRIVLGEPLTIQSSCGASVPGFGECARPSACVALRSSQLDPPRKGFPRQSEQ